MSRAYRSRAEAIQIRTEACRMAATVLARRDDPLVPMIWNLATFFEAYIAGGAVGTLRDFGPKDPVELRPVKRGTP